MLAVMHEGDEITTIEGLGTPDDLHPMQAAFVKHDGYQCGYCTPGQICSAIAVLAEIKAGIPSHATVDLKPWRVEAAEAEMPRGAKAVTTGLLAGARTTPDNAFKVPLVERTLGAMLTEAKG